MPQSEPNPGLERVRHELRASGGQSTAPNSNPQHSGIHTRGYLPHLKREGAAYFVTFRLADSLPQKILLEFKRQQAEKLRTPAGGKPALPEEINREFQRQVERYLDRGVGECQLQRPEIAQMVAGALLHFHEKQYLLDEWVIMPNHVHLILWPMPNHTLSDILRSRKRHTSRQANQMVGRTGQTFWQRESYDHWIRDENQKARIRRYIRQNPVTAKLCSTPEAWPWGIAYDARRKVGGLPAKQVTSGEKSES